MNKVIEELAIKSGFKKYDGTSIYSPYIEGMELNDELEDFANLIIEKCLSIIDDESKSHWDVRGEIFNDVKKHFGIE